VLKIPFSQSAGNHQNGNSTSLFKLKATLFTIAKNYIAKEALYFNAFQNLALHLEAVNQLNAGVLSQSTSNTHFLLIITSAFKVKKKYPLSQPVSNRKFCTIQCM